MLDAQYYPTLSREDDRRNTLTLADEVSAEDWVQDRLYTVHLLNNKRLAKPYSQLQSGGEIRVLTRKKGQIIKNTEKGKRPNRGRILLN